jgi:hypothetical protein
MPIWFSLQLAVVAQGDRALGVDLVVANVEVGVRESGPDDRALIPAL